MQNITCTDGLVRREVLRRYSERLAEERVDVEHFGQIVEGYFGLDWVCHDTAFDLTGVLGQTFLKQHRQARSHDVLTVPKIRTRYP